MAPFRTMLVVTSAPVVSRPRIVTVRVSAPSETTSMIALAVSWVKTGRMVASIAPPEVETSSWGREAGP